MSNEVARGAMPRTPAAIGKWDEWREPIAGVLITVGLCWPFVFSSVLPVRWWMFLPCAIIGGLLRQRTMPRRWSPLLPLWGFFLVVFGFAGYSAALDPMPAYGFRKLLEFVGLAGLAYLGAARQAPLTEGLATGVRWTLGATLAVCAGIAVMNRSLFLSTDMYTLSDLRQSFATIGFPLSIAMGAMAVIPRRVGVKSLFAGGLVLLCAAGLEVFVRGRFHAVLLGGVAVLLVLGPPWRHMFWRITVTGVLAVVALALYVNLLPLFGGSYLYLGGLDLESLGGRLVLFGEAWNGFLAHPLGQGIGSFQFVDPMAMYPHNIVLESAFEMGIFGLVSILAVYAFVFRRAWQLWLSPPHRVFAGLLVVTFMHLLKAGNIATFAFQWVFLYLLVVNTRVSASWPLLRGRAVQ